MNQLDPNVFSDGFNGLLNAHMKSLTKEKTDWWYGQLSDSDDTAFTKAMWKLRDKDRFPGWKEIKYEISQYTVKVKAEHRGACHHSACVGGVVVARVWYDGLGTTEPRNMAFNCKDCSRDKSEMRNIDPSRLVFDDWVHQWKDKKSMVWDHANIYNVEGRYKSWDIEGGYAWLKRMQANQDKIDSVIQGIVGPKHPDHEQRELVRAGNIARVERCEVDNE